MPPRGNTGIWGYRHNKEVWSRLKNETAAMGGHILSQNYCTGLMSNLVMGDFGAVPSATQEVLCVTVQYQQQHIQVGSVEDSFINTSNM